MTSTTRHWERMSLDEITRLLACDTKQGLKFEEVAKRREVYGKNELTSEQEGGVIEKIIRQLINPLSIVLLVAGVATFVLGEIVDTWVISIALLLNVLVGAFQEERASKAFERLNASQARHAIVMRDGKRLNIEASDLVPGDLVLLEGGYFVPADMRIIEEKDVKVNEAALTGEWLAVSKSGEVVEKEVPLAERANMLWMGTLIESGYGKAVVVAIGTKTEIGKIAESLGAIQEQATPLQQNIRILAHALSYMIAGILVVLLIMGYLRDLPLIEMILIAIAIAVAAIPAGLPAAVTAVLAIGMESILKRGGLVRNLLAAETLGSTTVILTDKTGTLTEAHMKLSSLHSYQGIRDHNEAPTHDNKFLLELAVLTSDAFIEEGKDAPSKLTVHGRPIEKAVVLSGLEAGISQPMLLEEYTRLDYLQFTSKRRFGCSLHHNPAKKTNRLIISGAPETLLSASDNVRLEGKRVKMTNHERKRITDMFEELTKQGKRVIAIAYRDATFERIPEEGDTTDVYLKGAVFAGLLTFEDPIREDVRGAIEEVTNAGARVMVMTGDNAQTARYIAGQVGITKPGDELFLNGSEIDDLTDEALFTKLQETRVIARALPEHKLRIAKLLRRNGEVVAMTGDGINDAPALRAASIGIAVGSGTEVAKESSDLVLIDNSFSIIVAAIEEGRRILDNLRKIVAYLLSTSFSEIILIGGALAGGGAIPLLPAQILWANIVGGDLMSFAFAFEKKDPTAMERDPRSARTKNLLTKELKILVTVLSLVSGAVTIVLYYYLASLGTPIEELRTVMFVAVSLDALFFSLSLKSFDTPLWRVDLLSNKYLLGALGISGGLLLLALLLPPLQSLLSLVPLTPIEKLLLLGVGLVNLIIIEAVKYVLFQRKKKPLKIIA